jgi:hypothetical protein
MNPTYDTLASGVWSNVELNVGVICVCMPTFRRFFALILPRLCGSAEGNLSIHGDGQGPKDPSSSGKKISKKKNTLPDSLFVSTIMQTVDTRVSSMNPEDDELQLFDLVTDNAAAESNGSICNTLNVVERSYKAQNKLTLPREW